MISQQIIGSVMLLSITRVSMGNCLFYTSISTLQNKIDDINMILNLNCYNIIVFISDRTQSKKQKIQTFLRNNNSVKRWFGFLKNNILRKRNNLMPSEFVGTLNSRLKSLFYDYFSENASEPSF
jgi:hypothetical protein